MQNLLPVEMVEAVDISNAVLWLASDEARYVTGTDAAGRRRVHAEVSARPAAATPTGAPRTSRSRPRWWAGAAS